MLQQKVKYEVGDLVMAKGAFSLGYIIDTDAINKTTYRVRFFTNDEIEARWVPSQFLLLVK